MALAFLVASPSSFAQLPYSEDFSTTTYRDGAPDQTTADWNTGFMQLLLPTSPSLTGITFADTTVVEIINGSRETRSIALADMNSDGHLDLIDGIKGRTGIQLNRDDGTFFGGRSYVVPDGANTRSIAVGDVDRDGDIDFVEGNLGNRVRLYLNNGFGTDFVVQDVSSDNQQANDVVLADINGDGFLDIVLANLNFNRNVLYTNTGDPLHPFGPEGQSGTFIGSNVRESSRRAVVGDLDNDGDLDIIFVNEDEPNPNDNNRQQRNRVFMNELAQGSAGSFVTSEIEIPSSDDVDFSMAAGLGDLNGDGYLDLVVGNYLDGQASKIYLNNGSGTVNVNPFTTVAVDFTVGTSPSDPVNVVALSLGDADNDGDLDIFLASESRDFRNRVYFNDGSGTNFTLADVGPIGQAPLTITNPGQVAATSIASAVGDIDRDGDLDWVVGNYDGDDPSGGLENNIFRNTGTGGGAPVQQLQAYATSVQVDASGQSSVRLFPQPVESMIGPAFHNRIDYWVTGDGGANWSAIMPDGRPVPIGAGTDVRWRAELRSDSPSTAAGLALMQLDIAVNSTGPVVQTPIGSATVQEGDSVTGLPIVPDITDADGDELNYSLLGLPAGSGLAIDPFTGDITGTPTNEDSLASPVALTVFATDGTFSATDDFTLTVNNENDPPAFASTPPAGNAVQGSPYTYAIFADDPDPNETMALRFSATTLPAWLTLTDNLDGSATLSGTPGNDDVTGNNSVTLVVTDPGGLTDTQSFVITVDNVNDQPVFTSTPPAGGATQGVPYTYSVTADDPDAGETGQLAITATVAPAWLTLTDNGDGTATLSGTPGNGDVTGDNSVTLVVTDPGGLTDTQSFVVTVQNANDAPMFTSAPVTTATQDQPYTYAVAADDPDDGETAQLTITATTLPAWLTLADNGDGTATLSGTPGNDDVTGDNSVTLVVTDPGGLTDTQSFVITVDNVNDQPVFTSTPPAGGAMQGMPYTYSVTADDPDAGETGQLAITATVAPAWLMLIDNGDGTATLSGTPGNGDVTGDNSVTLVVTDPGGLTDAQSFVVTVQNANDAPTFMSVPVTNATQDQIYTYSISASDTDPGETAQLSITASTLPGWLTLIDNGDGTATLSGTPLNADSGMMHAVSLVVTDPAGATDTQNFDITVQNVNDAPVITSTPPAGGASTGVVYTYNVTAADPDSGETTMLSFAAPTLPGWLVFTDNGDGTATLTGTPSPADSMGNNDVTITVTDPGGLGDSQSFTVVVVNVNQPPQFVTTPPTVAQESRQYSYAIRAVDPNDDGITITAATLPAWLTLTDNGGGFARLSGTPAGSDIGDHTVILEAREQAPAPGQSDSQQFVITVTSTGSAPEISLIGSPEIGIFLGDNYNDPGATAMDVEDGDLTSQITTSSNVNTSATGVYTVDYTVFDSAGNQGQASRIVRVVAKPNPNTGIGAGGPLEIFALLIFAGMIRVTRRQRVSV